MKLTRAKLVTLFTGLAFLLVIGFAGAYSLPAWYRFHTAFESLGKNDQGLLEFRHRQTGIIMVWIPSGSFRMGSPESADVGDREKPRHDVTLGSFLLAKYEVTQEQWSAVLGDNPSHVQRADLPVEGVSWDDCRRFCELTGLDLPTEAQWEYACRAGETEDPGYLDLLHLGWFRQNSPGVAQPGGEKKPNAFGLHDIYGNVREWCRDVWDEHFYKTPESARRNPECTEGSTNRVYRGGSWPVEAGRGVSSYRHGVVTYLGFRYLGLRPAYYPVP